MSWWNKVFAILRWIIQTMTTTMTAMTTTMTDYFSDEIEFDDELPIWIKLQETFDSSLFISNEKYILLWLYQFVLSLKEKKSSCFIQKTTGYILKEENKWKNYDQ